MHSDFRSARRFVPAHHRPSTVVDLNLQVGAYIAKTGKAAVHKTDAARLLGVSVDFFDDHIAHELPSVVRGRRRLYAVGDVLVWLAEHSERVAA